MPIFHYSLNKGELMTKYFIFSFLVCFSFFCDAAPDNKPLWQQKESEIYQHVLNVEADIVFIEELIFKNENLLYSRQFLQKLNEIKAELSINEL